MDGTMDNPRPVPLPFSFGCKEEPGHGTTFKIYLPRVDEPLNELQQRTIGEELLCGNETILVVEDEDEVRKLAVRILQRHGYKALEASHRGRAELYSETL